MIDILKTNKAQNYQLKINILKWGGIFSGGGVGGVLFSRKSSPPPGNIFFLGGGRFTITPVIESNVKMDVSVSLQKFIFC